MPTSSARSTLLRTYTWLAASAPTSTTPARLHAALAQFLHLLAHPASTRAAVALPSISLRGRSFEDHRSVLVEEHPVFQVVFHRAGQGHGFGVAADGDQVVRA
jgi:hypothetical protein